MPRGADVSQLPKTVNDKPAAQKYNNSAFYDPEAVIMPQVKESKDGWCTGLPREWRGPGSGKVRPMYHGMTFYNANTFTIFQNPLGAMTVSILDEKLHVLDVVYLDGHQDFGAAFNLLTEGLVLSIMAGSLLMNPS